MIPAKALCKTCPLQSRSQNSSFDKTERKTQKNHRSGSPKHISGLQMKMHRLSSNRRGFFVTFCISYIHGHFHTLVSNLCGNKALIRAPRSVDYRQIFDNIVQLKVDKKISQALLGGGHVYKSATIQSSIQCTLRSFILEPGADPILQRLSRDWTKTSRNPADIIFNRF